MGYNIKADYPAPGKRSRKLVIIIFDNHLDTVFTDFSELEAGAAQMFDLFRDGKGNQVGFSLR